MQEYSWRTGIKSTTSLPPPLLSPKRITPFNIFIIHHKPVQRRLFYFEDNKNVKRHIVKKQVRTGPRQTVKRPLSFQNISHKFSVFHSKLQIIMIKRGEFYKYSWFYINQPINLFYRQELRKRLPFATDVKSPQFELINSEFH